MQARRGDLAGAVRTGATFGQAADEWLRYMEQGRACKPATLKDYRALVGACSSAPSGSWRRRSDLAYRPRADAAQRLSEAFGLNVTQDEESEAFVT